MNLHNKTVLFIDLDNTLIKTISGKIFPENITDFRIQLPVLDKIKEKLPNLNWFFVVTNQGGIGKFVSEYDFDAKILGITSFCVNYLLCEIGDSIYCTSNDSNNPLRKPNTGMLESMCDSWDVQNKQEMLMIGDASGKEGDFSNSDKKCAENFGIDYIDVRDFLNL